MRAIQRSHWGVVRVDVEREPVVDVHAEALLPDGRTAWVRAWGADAATVNATVSVGRFGDADLERAYLQTLRDTLAGKPKPYRNWKYSLPE